MQRLPYYTIGHSTRSLEQLVTLLQGAGVTTLVDVRTVPRSRTNPQFNLEAMAESLQPFGIGYLHLAGLGGLRGRRKDVPAGAPSPNAGWQNSNFRNYADHALGEAFAADLQRLRTLGQDRRSAVMCAEAVWWRCHRRIIADYLLAADEAVFHIMERGRVDPARLTPGASVQADGHVLYPAPQQDQGSGNA